jgi:hypothetical protein
MVQIAKTILPDANKLHIALRRVFGIGPAQAVRCAEAIGVSQELRVADLSVRVPGRAARAALRRRRLRCTPSRRRRPPALAQRAAPLCLASRRPPSLAPPPTPIAAAARAGRARAAADGVHTGQLPGGR